MIKCIDDENQLPDGTFAIKLSEETQERLGMVLHKMLIITIFGHKHWRKIF